MIKMLKNNNQEAVKRISRRSLKQNRIRNMFAVLAIILTTFMFTTVFSIGFSLGKKHEYNDAERAGYKINYLS